jgi:hypothetical protein
MFGVGSGKGRPFALPSESTAWGLIGGFLLLILRKGFSDGSKLRIV